MRHSPEEQLTNQNETPFCNRFVTSTRQDTAKMMNFGKRSMLLRKLSIVPSIIASFTVMPSDVLLLRVANLLRA